MQFLASDAAPIVADPDWLAHRYDPTKDHVHFVRASRDDHRVATFLTNEHLPTGADVAAVDRAAAVAAAEPPARLNFIFHSAYCCSTLLARACDIPGVAMGLKEPVILNDLSGWRRRGADPGQVARRIGDALTLLARPFEPGEQIVIKPSNVVNALAPAMLATAPSAHALLIYAPLPAYLASVARKGMWGRLWVRELFVKLSRDGLTDYGFTPDEVMQQTDLQIAGIGWLSQHRLFARMVERFGPERVRTLESERMLADPAASMRALDRHFAMGLSDDRLATVASDAFGRHSKTGERFDGSDRAAMQKSDIALHGDEVAKVATWIERVAESAGQKLDLPASLI